MRSSATSDALRSASKSTALTRSFCALTLVRLGEADHRATQRRDRSGFVVAVLAAKPCGRNQERAWRCNLLVQSSHGGVERLDAHPQRFMPGRQVHLAEVAFVVQRGKPVDSLHRAGGQPILRTLVSASASRASSIRRTSTPFVRKLLRQRFATPPLSGMITTRQPGPSSHQSACTD